MSETLPLAAASARLRGRPGRPRKALAPPAPPVVEQIRRLLDLEAAAAYLSCSPWTVRSLESTGILKRMRIPTDRNGGELRKVLFDREDLDRLITSWKDSV